MDTPGYPQSDPSRSLLNEIEILLAQTRLMELYLKQAQVSAAHKAVAVDELHQAELAALRRALAEKEQVVAAQQSAVRANEKTLAEQIENLQVRVGDQQNLLASKEGQQRQADVEIAGLRQRIVDLETAKKQSEAAAQRSSQTCRDLEAALAALRLELEDNRRDFQRQQLVAQELDESARQQLAGLQNQLVERQVWAGAAANELQSAKDELVELHQHIAELQDERQELATAAAGEVELARRGFEAELSGLQSALDERDHDLQNSQLALGEIERKVSAEVENLRSQFADRQEFLDVRDDQLREALGQVATLQQRVGELEAVHQQATIGALESERTRDVLESQIASLRHEVAVRERALTERQEAVTAVELALHGRIQALQQELAGGRSAIQARESELDQLRGESDSRRVRVTALESAADIEMAARHALESDRAKLESDLAGLNEVLDGKAATLRAAEIALRTHQEQSAGEIAGLGRQVDEQKGIIDQGATDLDQLRAESARWREQNNQSEQSRHELELNWRQTETRQRELAERLEAKENELRWVQSNAHEQQETAFRAQAAQFEASDGELRGELARLRGELEERQKSTEQTQAQQAIAEEQHSAALAQQETRLHNEISDLHNRLAHQQDQVEKAHSELSGLHAEVSGLRERSAGAEMTRAELDHRAALTQTLCDELAASLQAKENELEATRATQLIANQRAEQISQDYAAQIEKLSAEISRQSAALQEHEPALTRQEQLLRSEIESLILEAQEKNQILQNRNDELVRAKSERDMLQERLKDLESATNQNEAAVSEESEQMRTEFQAQLALLQAELSQKEWALEEQCASASGLDQQYREQVEVLNQKLAQAEAPAQQDPDQFVIDTDKINGAQRQRYSQYGEVAEMPTRGSNYPHLALGSRRWRTRLDRKRRWKTSSAVAQSSYKEILVSETKKDRNFRKDSQ